MEFLGIYGDPISGFDLRKPVVVYYPTYFAMTRIIFVIVTLSLWHLPQIQLIIRLLFGFAAFITLSVVKPYETRIDNYLELLNEGTFILVINVLFVFTDVMNEGNPNDMNGGNTSNLKRE